MMSLRLYDSSYWKEPKRVSMILFLLTYFSRPKSTLSFAAPTERYSKWILRRWIQRNGFFMSVSFLGSSSCSAVILYTPVFPRDCMRDSKGANLVGMTFPRLIVHSMSQHDRGSTNTLHHWIHITSPKGIWLLGSTACRYCKERWLSCTVKKQLVNRIKWTYWYTF